MSDSQIGRRLAAEGLGACLLLATVVGSGIMAELLSGGNVAIALLGNTLPTAAILFVLIAILAPVSGAHFNPAVSIALCLNQRVPRSSVLPYVICQIIGAVLGVWLAHVMFDLPVLQVSGKMRWSSGQWVSESVATFGLLITILGCIGRPIPLIAGAVGLYIAAAYWFTASTSFANPAVTIARAMSDTFAGIAPVGVVPFIAAQFVGALLAIPVARLLWPTNQMAAANAAAETTAQPSSIHKTTS